MQNSVAEIHQKVAKFQAAAAKGKNLDFTL